MRKAAFIWLLLVASPALADNWYEGGTLQKATLEEWKKASPENQLATAADFIAALNGGRSIADITSPEIIADMKKRSENLRDCINESSSHPDTPSGKMVGEQVVTCTIFRGQ